MNSRDERYDMDIHDLNPAAVLAALYNAAKPFGIGFLHYKEEEMSMDEAFQILKINNWVDYVHGRPLKVGFKDGMLLRYDLYDRDQGQGKAAKIIAELRSKSS